MLMSVVVTVLMPMAMRQVELMSCFMLDLMKDLSQRLPAFFGGFTAIFVLWNNFCWAVGECGDFNLNGAMLGGHCLKAPR